MDKELKLLSEALNGIKEATSWSWEELAKELEKVMGERAPSVGTVRKVASGQTDGVAPQVAEFLQRALSGMTLRLAEAFRSSEVSRQKSEEQLAQARSLLDNARDIVFRYRVLPTPGFDFISRSVERLVGYTPEEYYRDYTIGFEVLDEEGKKKASEHLEGRGFGAPTTARWRRKDGSTIWVEELDHPVFDEGGRLIAIEGIVRDISDRKSLEDQLVESENLAKALINAYTGIALLIDSEGTVLAMNQGVAERLNKSLSEVVGRSIYDYYPPDVASARREKAEEVIRSGRPLRYMDSFSSGRFMDTRIQPLLDDNGNVTRMAVYAHDVTELRRVQESLESAREGLELKVRERTVELMQTNRELEEEIVQRKEAEKTLLSYESQLRAMAEENSLAEERERRRIAAHLHDDIGQTLAVTRLKVATLKELSLPPEVEQVLKEMDSIIGMMIDSTRTLIFDISPPILYELGVEAALESLCRRVGEGNGLEVSFVVKGNCSQIDDKIAVFFYQAVRELLVNVRKHSRAEKVGVALEENEKEVVVRVEDDGVGFPDVPETSGSRFGLFHLKERLRHLGGEFSIQSTPGHGATIVLSVPLENRSVSQ
jgi:PAS domain S-box-containing protein